MAYAGPARKKASVRVTQDDNSAAFVAGSNSGLFAAITFIAAGDANIDLDRDQLPGPILVQDKFYVQIEGPIPGIAIVERLPPARIRVRTFNLLAGAYALNAFDYSLEMNTVFFG